MWRRIENNRALRTVAAAAMPASTTNESQLEPRPREARERLVLTGAAFAKFPHLHLPPRCAARRRRQSNPKCPSGGGWQQQGHNAGKCWIRWSTLYHMAMRLTMPQSLSAEGKYHPTHRRLSCLARQRAHGAGQRANKNTAAGAFQRKTCASFVVRLTMPLTTMAWVTASCASSISA